MVEVAQSILDGLYEEIMNRFRAQVPKCKHFDIYYGQYDQPLLDENNNPIAPSFNRPATFFEWPKDIPFTPLGLKRKVCTIEFTLHHVQDVVQDIDARTPDAVRAKGHAHTAYFNDAQLAIEGFNGNQATIFKHFGTISLIGLMPYDFNGNQVNHKQRYRVRVVVDAAKQFFTKLADLTPPIEVTDKIDIEIEEL